ncbi:ABC transporter [Xylaria longipes]|nr:ABC transporter [Xylaria longipes]
MFCFQLFVARALLLAYDNLLGFNGAPEVETRTIDEIYEAAVVEGGDEAMQQDGLKAAFEARFPKMTLNLTVDLSKYQDGDIDHQLTLHDYPRWDQEGALLHYQPLDFYKLYPAFRDIRGAWHATAVYPWTFTWNMDRVANGPMEFTDFLKPEFKDTLVLTYPTDDDASLYAFDLILQEFGIEWFDALLTQNPHWVRGTQTAATLMSSPNSTAAATFTSIVGLSPSAPLNISIPTKGHFNTWPQRAAILKDAPHPEGAKLLHNFILSKEYQRNTGVWSVRRDVPAPAGFPELIDIPSTDPTEFQRFLADRARVERSRFFFESKLGTPQGPSSVNNGI